MITRALWATVLLCFAQGAFAADEPAEDNDKDDTPAPAGSRTRALLPPPPELADFCFVPSTPAAGTYTVIRRVKLGKGTYGLITDILPKFAENAKRLGADAIVEYDGAQRFGLFPWRMVRPVVHGVAVKWIAQPASCAAVGGTTLQSIMETGQRPTGQPVPQPQAAASTPAP